MLERVNLARDDSDTALFFDLMYLGELVLKTVVAGLVAAVDDDRHRYRQLYRLVRADGLGEWSQSLDEVLTGPASQDLVPEARDAQRELNQNLPTGSWQYEAVAALHRCLKTVDPTCEDLPTKVNGRRW